MFREKCWNKGEVGDSPKILKNHKIYAKRSTVHETFFLSFSECLKPVKKRSFVNKPFKLKKPVNKPLHGLYKPGGAYKAAHPIKGVAFRVPLYGQNCPPC